MPRNFFRRVEVTFPIEGKGNRERVIGEGLDTYLRDNQQSWEMLPDGTYRRLSPGGDDPFNAQRNLLERMASRR